jgi:hypothetical protein
MSFSLLQQFLAFEVFPPAGALKVSPSWKSMPKPPISLIIQLVLLHNLIYSLALVESAAFSDADDGRLLQKSPEGFPLAGAFSC